MAHEENVLVRNKIPKQQLYDEGSIDISTNPIHTVKGLELSIPKGRFSVITGVSGSGKTTLILESLYPSIKNSIENENLPEHVDSIDYEDINKIHLIDATPIGKNVRSTVATYSGILSDIRKLYADLEESQEKCYSLKDFSYNTGKLRCPTCNGTGQISMDVQFLPDVEIECPDCDGLRYSKESEKIKFDGFSIKDLMALTIDEAIGVFLHKTKIEKK